MKVLVRSILALACLLGSVSLVGAAPGCGGCNGGCTGTYGTGCDGSACWCAGNPAACTNWSIGGSGCNPGPGQPPKPPGRGPIYQALTFQVTLSVTSASSVDIFDALEAASGWTIDDSGVTPFTVTGGWTDTGWGTIVGDILSDASLCFTVNTTTKVVTVSNC